jgi:DNA gyrase/topoisomerase IV subunit B
MSEDNDRHVNHQTESTSAYTDANIRHLNDMEHVRTRPGMYIGRLGMVLCRKMGFTYSSKR